MAEQLARPRGSTPPLNVTGFMKVVYQATYATWSPWPWCLQVEASKVAEQLARPRGSIEALQEAACRRAGLVAAFAERLGWSDLHLLLTHFQVRAGPPPPPSLFSLSLSSPSPFYSPLPPVAVVGWSSSYTHSSLFHRGCLSGARQCQHTWGFAATASLSQVCI